MSFGSGTDQRKRKRHCAPGWNLESIPSSKKVDICFELAGLEEGDYDENDIYTEYINPSFVIGADKWEGD